MAVNYTPSHLQRVDATIQLVSDPEDFSEHVVTLRANPGFGGPCFFPLKKNDIPGLIAALQDIWDKS